MTSVALRSWICETSVSVIKITDTDVSQIQLRNATDVIGTAGPPLAQWLPGVNEQGPNFSSGIFWPNTKEIDYYSQSGLKSIRPAFRWDRMQPALNGPLDATQLANFDTLVAAATA